MITTMIAPVFARSIWCRAASMQFLLQHTRRNYMAKPATKQGGADLLAFKGGVCATWCRLRRELSLTRCTGMLDGRRRRALVRAGARPTSPKAWRSVTRDHWNARLGGRAPAAIEWAGHFAQDGRTDDAAIRPAPGESPAYDLSCHRQVSDSVIATNPISDASRIVPDDSRDFDKLGPTRSNHFFEVRGDAAGAWSLSGTRVHPSR